MSFERVVSINLFAEANQLAQSRAWWEGALGLPVSRVGDSIVTFFMGNNTLLNLHAANATNRSFAGRNTGLYFKVPSPGDLGRLLDRLKAHDQSLQTQQPVSFMSGQRITLRDPAGNTIHLFEADEFDDQPHMFEAPAIVTVGVSKLRRALDFYVGRLELPMIDQLGPDVARLMSDGTQIVLIEPQARTFGPPIQGETGICIGLQDAQYTFDQLESRGIRFSEPPMTVGSSLLASVQDPDGNILTLLGAN